MAVGSLDGNTFGPSVEKQPKRAPIPRFDSSNSVDTLNSSTSETGAPLTDYRPINGKRRRRRGGRSRKSSSGAGGELDDWEDAGHSQGAVSDSRGYRGIPEEEEDGATSPLFEEVVEYLKEVSSMLGGLSADSDDPTTPDTSEPPVPQPPTQKPNDNGALKLRLDINLDVVLELKAKIHGSITLSLLAVRDLTVFAARTSD
ncbi:hypothetical protein V5O48_012532 [Marasmius crinis-equi]|uniref:Uncharacterized protein n=1 Tax=Marasmius crinis-equi TaxID=585013 RepID=A0ABR3F2T5_9AGAR